MSKPRYTKTKQIRFDPKQIDRVERLVGKMNVSDFIRDAVDEKLINSLSGEKE